MTRDNLLTAKREGVPFEINMSDRKSYWVEDAERFLIGRTTVIGMDDKDCPRILPLLTMTGISYLRPNGA